MRAIRKLYHRNVDLFLPLAAVVIGLVIMVCQKPIVQQASLPIPMPQSFSGEYSYDGARWQPLETDAELSALDGDLYLRGHFERDIPKESRLYFYSNHIGSEISVDGEVRGMDILLELEKYGIDIQPSMCSRGWDFYYFKEGVSSDSLIEMHLKNPHTFGNKNAYNDFLETLCCTANEQEYLAKYLGNKARPNMVTGIILVIAGAILLCSAVVSTFMRFPIGIEVVQGGLLACFAGGSFLLDTVDLSFRSGNHIVNTFGWQICLMYSVYLLGIMARDQLSGKRKKTALCVMAVSAAVNVAIILLSFAGVVLMYDTLHYWVILQWIICPILCICCVTELFSGNKKKTVNLVCFLVMFICVLLDSADVLNSIYSNGTITKAAIMVFFLIKFIQSAEKVISNFKASNRAHKLEKELEESRIAIMLSQIQPHFIFNVLGTIRGLCREDPEQAWRGLGDFSAYLRANMNALTNAKSIPFEMELGHVETYLRLEQMRLGEKLNVVYDIREKEFFIPPLILQPLVENAVKHGIFYKAEGGTILISSSRKNNRIILTVKDDGIGFEAAARQDDFDKREHHGLENVRSRVEKMLGGTLWIESRPEQGSTVTLEFPVDAHF